MKGFLNLNRFKHGKPIKRPEENRGGEILWLR